MFYPRGIGDTTAADLATLQASTTSGDAVPAGGVSYLWSAADQTALNAGLPASYSPSGVAGVTSWLSANSGVIIAAVAVLGLMLGQRRR